MSGSWYNCGMEEKKVCLRCRKVKPKVEFHKNRANKDGLVTWCKVCRAEAAREYYVRNKPRMMKKNKEWNNSKNGKEYARRRGKRIRKENPTKAMAYDRIRAAKLRGEVDPAKLHECLDCGKQAEQNHHHMGYSAEHALNVVPLCVSCHIKRHAK